MFHTSISSTNKRTDIIALRIVSKEISFGDAIMYLSAMIFEIIVEGLEWIESTLKSPGFSDCS